MKLNLQISVASVMVCSDKAIEYGWFALIIDFNFGMCELHRSIDL